MFRLLFLLTASSAAFGALPKGWKACSKSDPKYSECLRKEIENAIKSLADGDKSLKVQPIDPLRISSLQLSKANGPVAIDLVFTDADGYGLKNIQVKEVKNDWKTMQAKIYVPKFTLLSHYKVDGKILLLPITGEGAGNLTFDQLTVDANIKWKRVKKGNTEYFDMESISIKFAPKRMYFNIENLFNGNKELGDSMNKFLNDSWKEILDDMRDPISEAFSAIFINIAGQVLSKIPANEIDK